LKQNKKSTLDTSGHKLEILTQFHFKTGQNQKRAIRQDLDDTGVPAKRIKLDESENTKFPKLKRLGLYKTYLDDFGDIFSSANLTKLEVLIDERHSYDGKFYDGKDRGRFDYFKHKFRLNHSSHLLDLLKLFPGLKTFKLGWSKSPAIEPVPEEFTDIGEFVDEDDPRVYVYQGPFANCSENLDGIPGINTMEIYNFNNLNGSESGFYNFLPNLSASLTTLKFSNFQMKIEMFMKILKSLENLELFSTHIKAVNNPKIPTMNYMFKKSKKKKAISSAFGPDIPVTASAPRTDLFVHDRLVEVDIFFEHFEINFENVQNVFAAIPNVKKKNSKII
jgi:hypothetical protein